MSSQIHLADNICVSGTTEAISIIILLCSPHSPPSMECVHIRKNFFSDSELFCNNEPEIYYEKVVFVCGQLSLLVLHVNTFWS